MRRVLVLRPEPGATATVKRARERGLDATALPLFEVEPVQWEMPDLAGFDALLLTSANAVRHGGEALRYLRGLPVHVIGEATAEAARNAGFKVIGTGKAGLERLLDSIEASVRLLHLCGEDRIDVPGTRQEIGRTIVYRSRELADPGEVPGDCVALIHSPRAGRRFAALVRKRSTIAVAAISPQAAEAVGDGWEWLEAADKPTDDALLALAARLCNKSAAG